MLASVRAVARSSGASEAAPPRFWGHLRVLERIGSGAFGEVYRAWDTRLDREVALKLLPPDTTGADPASSIIEEGRLLARVRHPNVVTIYGAERIEHRIGLWMEFVRGRTLEQMLRAGAVFTPADVVRLGLELCAAVSAVHAAGLLHRDIKAQNVMVAEDGRQVLIDFGTGQEVANACTGGVTGTPLYLAPEVLAGGAPTTASDLYSVGVLLYHLLTGTYPVVAATLAELRGAHAHGTPVALLSVRGDIPPRLARVIDRGIQAESAQRYASADGLAADLAATRTPSSTVRMAAAAALALVVVVALVVWGGRRVGGGAETHGGVSDAIPAAVPTAEAMGIGATPVLSLPGETFQLALSPDGTQMAFVWAATDNSNLYVNRLGTDQVLRLTHTPGLGSFPAWSPDGRFIAFNHRLATSNRWAISVVPATGGPYRTVWTGDLILGRGLDWSPDGDQLVASARTPDRREHQLLVVTVGTGAINWLPSGGDGSDDSYPVFSPDGRTIGFVRNSGSQPGIYLYRRDSRNTERVMAAKSAFKRLAWSTGGESLFFASIQSPGNDRLWKLNVRGGQVEPVAGTGAGASEPSVAKGVDRIVFLQQTLDSNLYRVRLSASSPASVEQLPGTIRRETHPDISPDGSRLVFVSDRTGYSELWTVTPSGGDPRPVTSLKTLARHPRWAPDGQRLAFVGLEAGPNNHDLYVVDASGGGMRRLTEEPSTEQWPTWSRDGKWIYFTSDRTGAWQIWKISEVGGPALQVTTNGALKAWESRDGRFVLYSDESRSIWRMPVGGGPSERVLDFLQQPNWGGEWVPTDGGIFFLNIGGSRQTTVELFEFATGRTRTVHTLPGLYDGGSGFTISRDGAWLVYPQRDLARTEIMLLGMDR